MENCRKVEKNIKQERPKKINQSEIYLKTKWIILYKRKREENVKE